MEAEALKNKPKRPLPAIFKFRIDHLEVLPEGQRQGKFVKQIWDGLSPEIRLEYQNTYKRELEQWKVDLEKWKQIYHVEKIPRKPKKHASVEIEQVEKAKGREHPKKHTQRPLGKPKRPIPALFKFRMEQASEMPEGQRGIKYTKQLWDRLSSKSRQKYIDQFNKEIKEWKENLAAWKMSNKNELISKDDSQSSVHSAKVQENETKELFSSSSEVIQIKPLLEKPKKPMPAAFQFRIDKMEEIPKGYREAKSFKEHWDALDEKEREAYELEYRRGLEKWRSQMKIWETTHSKEKKVSTISHKRQRFVSIGVQTQRQKSRKNNRFE